jgi:ParB family chromosome partitioning protein
MGVKNKYGAVGRGDTLSFEPETLKVITDPKHPLYDSRVERKPTEAMVLSIMRDGIIEPLVITRDGEDVYVVAGRQRRAAAIEANKRLKKEGGDPVLCPCVWRQAEKREREVKLYEISVSENELRSGDSPLERACKMQHLKNLGRDDRSIAVTFGCTVAQVRNLLALLDCAPAVQRAVEGGLSAAVAMQLSKLPREEQVKRLEKMVKAGVTKGASAHRAAKTGDTESRPRALPPKARERLRHALSNGETKNLTHVDQMRAEGAAAVLAFIDGDAGALKAWPDVEAIAREAIAKKLAKEEKGGEGE